MGSVCCKERKSPRINLGKVITRWTEQVCPSGRHPLKPQHINSTKMESEPREEKKKTSVKREVSFAEPEIVERKEEGDKEEDEEDNGTPEPPPRRNRRRRLSKSRGLGAVAESDEESDGELPLSRLPELLRRDTFCDALDFRLYSLKRLPGRRASSLDGLYWEDNEEEEGEEAGNVSRSAEELSVPPGPTIAESKADWLNRMLEPPQVHVTPDDLAATLGKMSHVEDKQSYTLVYSSSPSISESLQEFESSILDMLSAQEDSKESKP